ncbi:MAG: hypothetical protein JXA46_08200 [Dehalococcoidales bacterium]|nr:hypothetical protein [Dehalococcoidales bacterium]
MKGVNNHRRRVVVTGLGAVCPIGLDTSSLWNSLVHGRSGIDYISAFDASGSLGAVITVLAMNRNTAPPTINLNHPVPECDLDYVANRSRSVSIKTAMSNSFGFGGHNNVLIFRRPYFN